MKKEINRNLMDSLLDEQEQTYIQQFYENDVMREAVKKILLAFIYYHGVLKQGKEADPTRNYLLALTNRRELSDEQLGRETRATAEGIAALEAGFSALALYRKEETLSKDNKNPAR